MDGKVELSVERYEELREIERGEIKKAEAIKEELEKAKDEKTVLLKRIYMGYGYSTETSEQWVTKESVINEIQTSLENVQEAKNKLERKIEGLTFLERLKFLFSGTLDKG